jgi:hypothetical protein
MLKEDKSRNRWAAVKHKVTAIAEARECEDCAKRLQQLESELSQLEFRAYFDSAEVSKMKEQKKKLKSTNGRWGKMTMRKEVRRSLREFQGPSEAEVLLKNAASKVAMAAVCGFVSGILAIGDAMVSTGVFGINGEGGGVFGFATDNFSMGPLGGIPRVGS